MASSALEVQLTMVKIMQALRISDESITPPLDLEFDHHCNGSSIKQNKSVSFTNKSSTENKMIISTSEPTTSTFTPPIPIGQHSLSHSTQHTPYAQIKLVGTAPGLLRLKSEKDLDKLPAQMNSTPQAAPVCSLKFTKVSLKGNCTETGRQHVVQPANDSQIGIKRSVGGF